MKTRLTAVILAGCMMLSASSMADSISFSGTVEASTTQEVYSEISGTVAEVSVREGQTVSADTVIATVKTTKVYATEDGVITSVFGQAGDDAETVAEAYGAVMFLEGNVTYTISGSTSRAYDSQDNYIVHSGETVYLVSRNHTANKGVGTITTVDSSSFTVEVTEGTFYVGDSIDIFRDVDADSTSRIGRGSITRKAPTAVTGTGTIVSYAVQAGDTVTRGQLLFETVEGTPDGLTLENGTDIVSGVDGVVASLNVSAGGSINAGDVVAVIYPTDAMLVTAEVNESDLKDLQEGQSVTVELDYNQDEGITYEGKVEMISAVGTTAEDSDTTFPVYISFKPDENTRFGMTALVSTDEAEEAKTEENKEEEPEEETAEETENTEGGTEGAGD